MLQAENLETVYKEVKKMFEDKVHFVFRPSPDTLQAKLVQQQRRGQRYQRIERCQWSTS